MLNDRSRRVLFDAIAEDYDAVRPGYPTALVEDIIARSALPPGGRVLEIGSGTGQATLPFARRGYAMLCLDLGEQMTAVAARKCRHFPQVEFQVRAFEEWPVEREGFDLVISATAFHWLAPEVSYPRVAAALKPTGALAVFYNAHPLPFTGFFAAVQQLYRAVVPQWPPVAEDALTQRLRREETQFNQTGLFEPVQVRRYEWSETQTRDQHLRLLNTYSDHRSLGEKQRQELLARIGDLIDRDFGGVIERPYTSVLLLARKRA